MAEKENLTRWVWDLFPLSKDSWGAWQLADDEHRPDQRVFVRRYQGDGYLGPPVSMDMLARMIEQGHTPEDFAQREGYVPTQDDLDLLKRQYPNSDPYQPVWRAIKSDLVAAGRAPGSIQGDDAPTLLGLLKRSELSENGERTTPSSTRNLADRTYADTGRNEERAESSTGASPTTGKPKRSTVKGEARVKLIAALTLHHKYADGSCMNGEPIGVNKLAKAAKTSRSSASRFFAAQFKGHKQYRQTCHDNTKLITALKMLNGEFSPHVLNSRVVDKAVVEEE